MLARRNTDEEEGRRALSASQLEKTESESSGDEAEDFHELDFFDFEEDTYSSAIVSLVKDLQFLAKSTKFPYLRMARMMTQVGLLWLNIALQAFVIIEVKKFITARYVHDIRITYDTFERAMYGEKVGTDITLTVNGKARGIGGEFGGIFNSSHFALLGESEKYNVCQIPLSQPWFFQLVLCIWAFSTVGELRKVTDLFHRLIWKTRVVPTMENACRKIDKNDIEIYSLTRGVKAMIVLTMLLPRMVITLVLTWLGSRWLCATNCFEYLLLNAVALGFVMALPNLLYMSVVGMRTKRDVSFTKMNVRHEGEDLTAYNVIIPYIWLIIVIGWMMFYYSYLSVSDFGVLPQYKFDVHNVCTEYLSKRYAV